VTASAGDTSALVSWIPPANVTKGRIISYTLSWAGGVAVVSSSTTVTIIGGLRDGTQYSFRVLANYPGGGSGPQSAPSNSVVPSPAGTTWSATGAMHVGRSEGSSITVLRNGLVLIAGGKVNPAGSVSASSELYDPATGVWSTTGSMLAARAYHTATLLPDGKVLVAGGSDGVNALASAELYNPATGTWSATAPMATARFQQIATLLPGAKVLVAGGEQGPQPIASAELYNPTTGTWSNTGAMNIARILPTVTLLPTGNVLVAGGGTPDGVTATAELYNPAAGTWTATGSMTSPRWFDTATLLPTGKVLVAGGVYGAGVVASAELYDPAVGTWSATGDMADVRYFHVAALLPTGDVLVAGGSSVGGVTNPPPLASAELYDPATGSWAAAASMNTARFWPRIALLPTGKALVAAGTSDTVQPLASAELYGTT
jgi:Fibronectin type III domain/Galactose oxidase, central domain/Kelch motif